MEWGDHGGGAGEGRIQVDVSGRFSRRMEWTRDKGSWQTISSFPPMMRKMMLVLPHTFVCLRSAGHWHSRVAQKPNLIRKLRVLSYF